MQVAKALGKCIQRAAFGSTATIITHRVTNLRRGGRERKVGSNDLKYRERQVYSCLVLCSLCLSERRDVGMRGERERERCGCVCYTVLELPSPIAG